MVSSFTDEVPGTSRMGLKLLEISGGPTGAPGLRQVWTSLWEKIWKCEMGLAVQGLAVCRGETESIEDTGMSVPPSKALSRR